MKAIIAYFIHVFSTSFKGLYSLNFSSIIVFSIFITSCHSQNQSKSNRMDTNPALTTQSEGESKMSFVKEIYCGLVDHNGTLWLGSNGNGLYSYDGKSFSHYTKQDGLSHHTIISIMEDRDGTLWLGTPDGLCTFDRRTFTHIPIPFSDTSSTWLDKVYPTINPNAVHALAQDRKGDIWIGTCGAGAYRYDGNKFVSYLSIHGHKQEDNLYHNWISSITEDENGNIWFSSMTRGGASVFNGEDFTHFMPEDGLFTDMVRTIYKDRSGMIWLGYKATHDGGLTRYDGKSFTNFDKNDGLCNHSIRTMLEDTHGHMWFGGDLNYLCVFDGNEFLEFKSDTGQRFDGILTILEDSKGQIWFGGKNGLWKFDGKRVTSMTK